MDGRKRLCFIWIFTVLGTGSLLASCATKYWLQIKAIDLHQGLWQRCYGSYCQNDVYDKDNGKDMVLIIFFYRIILKFLKHISQQKFAI